MISNGRRQRQHGRLGPQRGSSDAVDLGGFPRPTGASLHARGEQSNRDLKHLTRQTPAATPAGLPRALRPLNDRRRQSARSRNSRQSPLFEPEPTSPSPSDGLLGNALLRTPAPLNY